jgi:hypothetical protein
MKTECTGCFNPHCQEKGNNLERGAKMYKITIEKLEVKEWTEDERRTIDERPYTDAELAETNRYFKSKQEQGETELKKTYEYVPVEKRSEKWVEVYAQVLEEINIPSVVMAAMGNPEL